MTPWYPPVDPSLDPIVDPGFLQTPNPLPTPFLTVAAFAAMWRPLSTAESAAATLLLQAATNWIVERLPSISPTDPAAQVVCLQVVREAIVAGAHAGLRQFSRTVGRRIDAGTLAEIGALLTFTPAQRELLGIGNTPQPQISVDDPSFPFFDPALPPNGYGLTSGWYSGGSSYV